MTLISANAGAGGAAAVRGGARGDAMKFILTIGVPGNFDVEDELDNLLEDEAILSDLAVIVGYEIAQMIERCTERRVARRDVEVKLAQYPA
jgi:hypothetical protein